MSKEIKKLIRAATEQGWRAEERRGGAIMLFPPDKEHSAVCFHRTPSDHRAMKNLVSELSKRGLVLA